MQRCKEALLRGLGVSWIHATEAELQEVVAKWAGLKRTLGALLLDQSQISGIGVAWGSEILCKAGLRPDIKACSQDLSNLVDTLLDVKNSVQQLYKAELEKTCDIQGFINAWFNNLYAVRQMHVYKTGTPITVSGRT